MIFIGADHRGYKLKEQVEEYLHEQGHEVSDLGTDSEASVDYPVIAEAVAKQVLKDKDNRGVIICGSGGGVCIAANKVKGIRAAEAWNADVATALRNDDDINVLCLSGDRFSLEQSKPIIEAFLKTPFDDAERRVRRLKQINDLEQRS